MVKKYYPYSDFVRDVKELAYQIGDTRFDAIIAVARGGMTLAHFLAEHLGIRTIHTINARSYEDTEKLAYVQLGHLPDISCYERVLLVDDIIDSGDTVRAILEKLEDPKDGTIAVATLFYKPSAVIEPDYYVHVADAWIDFFWTRDMHDFDDR